MYFRYCSVCQLYLNKAVHRNFLKNDFHGSDFYKSRMFTDGISNKVFAHLILNTISLMLTKAVFYRFEKKSTYTFVWLYYNLTLLDRLFTGFLFFAIECNYIMNMLVTKSLWISIITSWGWNPGAVIAWVIAHNMWFNLFNLEIIRDLKKFHLKPLIS